MTLPITLTDAAQNQIIKICNKQNNDAVRFSIQGGGCAGFEYNWKVINSNDIEEADKIIQLNKDKKFVIDNISLMYMVDSTFDFIEDIMGSFFKIDNPNANTSCGCGVSIGFNPIKN